MMVDSVLGTETTSSFLGLASKIANMTGTIKTLVPAKGFGFISREGEAKDLFFHSSALKGVMFDDLKQGDMVSFDVVDGMKGPAAENVSRA